MREAEELVDSIVSSPRIPAGRRRREIQRELRCHIEDFVLSAREAGRAEDEIQKLVLANFGEPAHIAKGFEWVYRNEWRRLRAVTYTFSTLLIAACLCVAIFAIQSGLAFSFGTPVMKMLASRHTVIEALDILASVAAYLGVISLENLFERYRFQKAALLLAIILVAIDTSCAAAGLRTPFLLFGLINAVFFRTIQLFIAPKFLRSGIVVICFPFAGLLMASQWSPLSQIPLATTSANWLVMGLGYQLMTDLAARIDAALLNTFERT